MMAISTETEAEAEVAKALKEGGVTMEYQRKKAKEMVKFFKQQQYNQAVEDSQVFGWTPKNEINNGRWTMFGLLVGMMTEYATGVDFIDQIRLTISVMEHRRRLRLSSSDARLRGETRGGEGEKEEELRGVARKREATRTRAGPG